MEKNNKFEIENLTDEMLSELIAKDLNIKDVNIYLERVEKSLNELGITVRKNKSELKSLSSIFNELANKWNSLDNRKREDEILKVYITIIFAGITKKESFKKLMEYFRNLNQNNRRNCMNYPL